MPRKHFGSLGVNKVHQGSKSVNVNIDRDQALDLAVAIIKGCKTERRIDLAFYTKRITKRVGRKSKIPPGKVYTTVTAE